MERDPRRQSREIREALERHDREQLIDILTHVFRHYVMQGDPPVVHRAAPAEDFTGLSFAQIIEHLQLHSGASEFQLFEVQGGLVSLRVGGRLVPIEAQPVAQAPLPAVPPPVAAPPPPAPASPAAAPAQVSAPAPAPRQPAQVRAVPIPAAPARPAAPAPASPPAAPAAAAAPAQRPAAKDDAAGPGGRFDLLEID